MLMVRDLCDDDFGAADDVMVDVGSMAMGCSGSDRYGSGAIAGKTTGRQRWCNE